MILLGKLQELESFITPLWWDACSQGEDVVLDLELEVDS